MSFRYVNINPKFIIAQVIKLNNMCLLPSPF